MQRATRLLAIPVILCGVITAAPDRITKPIDIRQATTLTRHVHPLALAAYDKGEAEPSFELDHVILMTKPSSRQQADLDRL
jgi:hypothetical protein